MLLKIQLFLFASLSAIAAQRVDPDVYASQPKQWMKYIKGNTRLTELSIPGTHDSGAFNQPLNALDSTLEGMNEVRSEGYGLVGSLPFNVGGIINKANVDTQDLDLTQQLNAGIRALDIRAGIARDSKGQWLKWHGKEPMLLSSKNLAYMPLHAHVFDPVVDFLKARPSETIIMSLKIDRITSKYTEADLTKYVLRYIARNRSKFYIWDPWTRRAPTLDTVRGKVTFLCQYDCRYKDSAGRTRTLGPRIDYLGNTAGWQGNIVNANTFLSIEDQYDLGGTSDDDYDAKVRVSVANMVRGLTSKITNTLYVTFTSASVFEFPDLRGTPRGFSLWVNGRVTNFFKANRATTSGKLGIVFSDFVDVEYIKDIILAGKQPWRGT